MMLRVRSSGFERIAGRLSRIGRSGDVREAVGVTAHDIARRARRALNDAAPPETRSGELEASIEVRQGDRAHQKRIGTTLDYGAYLEFGTLQRPPRPWLGPAFEGARAGFLDRLARTLRP